MTKEETLAYIKAYLDGDTAIGNIIPLRSVLESAIKYLEPSLPLVLDEAAKEYLRQYNESEYGNGGDDWDDDICITFKAGAEWMAGQGETIDGEVVKDINNNLAITAKGFSGKEAVFGDKVIVQIRKK